MECPDVIESAIMNLPKEFECEKLNDKTWLITTPFEYPDGDLIQIYLVKRNEALELTDLAETIRFFKTLDFDVFASKRRCKLFDEILRAYNVTFFRGELKIKVTTENLIESLTRAILNLSQAIFRVSDMLFVHRTGAMVTFHEEVEEVLKEAQVDYQVNYKVFGRSGKEYVVDLYIDLHPKPDLVETISTYSKTYAERLIDRVVRMWYDIQRLDGRFGYVTIVDDRSDVWRGDHFDLLEDLSKVYIWSEIEDYIRKIKSKL